LSPGLEVRVAGGTAPFTWMADGVPLVVALPDRETLLTLPGAGFVTLSVIDAQGRSARAKIRVW
jgi:penicillin-binding protein 1C